MKLLKLKLRNFMGIREYDLDAGGGNVAIYGNNAAGKTTVFSAYTYLLRGKDSSNRTDFAIKTVGPDGKALQGLEHSVEGRFELSDGSNLTLKKIYKEVFTRKRGSAEAQFGGHTTDHFVNGVPAQKREYDNAIAGIMPTEDAFMLLSDPRYFNDYLHWEKRREILINICGDVSDRDVIASDKALAGLADILEERSVDAHRKVVTAKQRDINTRLKEIPARVDEVARSLPEDVPDDKKPLQEEADTLQALLDRIDGQRRELMAGGGVSDLKVDLYDVENEMQVLVKKLKQAAGAGEDDNLAQRRELKNKIADVDFRLKQYSRQVDAAAEDVDKGEQELAEYKKLWEDAMAKEPAPAEVDDACPTCGQALPEEQVKAAQEKAVADFNEHKAANLERLEGYITGTEDGIKQAKKEYAAAAKKVKAAEKDRRALEKELADIPVPAKAPEVDPGADPGYQALVSKRDEIQAKIDDIKSTNAEKLAELNDKAAGAKERLAGVNQQLARFDQRAKGQARIAELLQEEKALAKEYEDMAQELHLLDQFTRQKVRLLDDKINSFFDMARFKLFKVNINGGIEPTCVTHYNGVEWAAGLNNAMQINVGMDIINTLAEHYGVTLPVFIDNAESVTNIIPSKSQQIKLYVDGDVLGLKTIKEDE